MKKFLTTVFSVMFALICFVMLGACGESEMDKVAGTYVMTDISGSVTANGQTVELSQELYEYYKITLFNDGTAIVRAKGAGATGTSIQNVGSWEYENGWIYLKSESSGITVIEEMKWENDTITYVTEQTMQGMKISMILTLQREVVEESAE